MIILVYLTTKILDVIRFLRFLWLNAKKFSKIFFINLLTNQVVCDIIKTVKGRSDKQKALKKILKEISKTT